MGLDHEILLEVGTNEFEIVEFIIEADKQHHFGINVAKVREIIRFPEIVQVPDSHPSIIGTANVRQKLIPIINLSYWLNLKYDFNPETAKVIVSYFNHQYNGFVVDDITRIHRITWADIKDYSSISDFTLAESVLGVINISNKLVQLLDFEKIVSEINPTQGLETADIDMSLSDKRMGKIVYLAEDSIVIRRYLKTNLEMAGYTVKVHENGKELLTSCMENVPDMVVTDLEMPVVDGTYVIKKLKETKEYQNVPIAVFSSLASEENERKILSIGANIFIGKPDLNVLIETIDKFLI